MVDLAQNKKSDNQHAPRSTLDGKVVIFNNAAIDNTVPISELGAATGSEWCAPT